MKRLAVALSVLAVAALIFAAIVSPRSTVPAPVPKPTPTPSDPLAWYKSLPTPTCPTDRDLLNKFYRHGQCPQGGRK